jgi:KDO2-lipid IV(A) lauroyltransferase
MPKPLLKRWSKAFRHGLAYFALRLFQSLVTSLGHCSRQRLAFALGHQLYLLPGPRRLVTQHLQFALGDRKTPGQLVSIVRQNFVHMAESLTELLWWMKRPAWELNRYITIEGEQEIKKALELGKGVIGLTSHLGNWELLGGFVSNFVVPISVIAEPIFDARLNQILIDARTHLGVKTIYRRESGKSLLRVLRSNGFVGMLADQDIPTSASTFVNFFGKLAFAAHRRIHRPHVHPPPPRWFASHRSGKGAGIQQNRRPTEGYPRPDPALERCGGTIYLTNTRTVGVAARPL